MAIPNIFPNTIGFSSIYGTASDGETPEYDVPYQITTTTPSQTITPKNIKNTLDYLKFTAEWLGYYLITFNSTARGGADRLWYFEPYKNGGALGYGNVFYYQNIIGEGETPCYEISSTFIAKLQKDDYIEFYNTLKSEEPPEEALSFYNIQTTIYQLEQVEIH
jgi:hypothetical protein